MSSPAPRDSRRGDLATTDRRFTRLGGSGVRGGPGREWAAAIGVTPRHSLNDAPLGAGFAVAVGFAGVGIALIALSSGSGRASGLVLLIRA
jgi:hypothetical protein